jgi:hypothetical protein
MQHFVNQLFEIHQKTLRENLSPLYLELSEMNDNAICGMKCLFLHWNPTNTSHYFSLKNRYKAAVWANREMLMLYYDFRGKALHADEYLLDFINIEDPDGEDEQIIEGEIVLNIKKFVMALGDDLLKELLDINNDLKRFMQ